MELERHHSRFVTDLRDDVGNERRVLVLDAHHNLSEESEHPGFDVVRVTVLVRSQLTGRQCKHCSRTDISGIRSPVRRELEQFMRYVGSVAGKLKALQDAVDVRRGYLPLEFQPDHRRPDGVYRHRAGDDLELGDMSSDLFLELVPADPTLLVPPKLDLRSDRLAKSFLAP